MSLGFWSLLLILIVCNFQSNFVRTTVEFNPLFQQLCLRILILHKSKLGLGLDNDFDTQLLYGSRIATYGGISRTASCRTFAKARNTQSYLRILTGQDIF